MEGCVRKILLLIIRDWFIVIYKVINLFRILKLHGQNLKIIIIIIVVNLLFDNYEYEELEK